MMKDYVTCPRCKADVALPGHTMLGELVKCSECGVEFEVLSLGPFIPDSEAMEPWEKPHNQVPVSPFLASARYSVRPGLSQDRTS
jgi:lysine biosynthesis protein LysW